MRNLHMPIRVVLYRDDGAWVAHCLEFDLMGDGETKTQALANLSDAISAQVQASLELDNPDNLFHPADGRLFAMFAAGRSVAEGDLRLKLGSITIDETATREYDAALVPA